MLLPACCVWALDSAGCAVSEPDGISAGSGQRRLESIDASFMPVAKFSYDSRDRLSEMELGNDERVEFSYDPMQIIMYEYDERCDYATELDELYISGPDCAAQHQAQRRRMHHEL